MSFQSFRSLQFWTEGIGRDGVEMVHTGACVRIFSWINLVQKSRGMYISIYVAQRQDCFGHAYVSARYTREPIKRLSTHILWVDICQTMTVYNPSSLETAHLLVPYLRNFNIHIYHDNLNSDGCRFRNIGLCTRR